MNAFNKGSWLWHWMLGHVSFDHLSRMNSKKAVKGISMLKFEKDRISDVCQFGKQIKSSSNQLKIW